MFSIPTAPPKQSVGETISVLGGRLSSATLLEDRRAAILGLRSFAKQYPASVASGALRSLIGSLAKDGEDIDTVKVVLETLLMLFSPNADSPEASEEIALWLADEFTQRQENITLLLDLLETPDFYSRLYSLQLLLAILSARTERTEECIFSAPLGISRLVAILDERREAVRNEAITLLTYLTPTSAEIQKLVAFESAFDRILGVVAADGGLADGGRVVEDCLILLSNLLRLNPSNQTLFRETGCMAKLSGLLRTAYSSATADDSNNGGDQREAAMAQWAEAQRNRNAYALLAVVRLFLVPGSQGAPQNQAAFWQHGLLFHALQLAFSHEAETQIRAEALQTCADVIRSNATLQENFAQLQVPSPVGQQQKQHARLANGVDKVYVIDGLLDMTLGVCAMQLQTQGGKGPHIQQQDFDLRFAACDCLKAYFCDHPEVRHHFLSRAIEGHRSGADETANVLTTVLQSPPPDPYRYWFAAVIIFHLVYDSPKAKTMAMAVTEGDESSGEEVVTSIQTISAHLISSLSRGDDERIAIGCLMLLLGWLFEDLDGVNDFLAETSNVHGLMHTVAKNAAGGSPAAAIVQGLCAALLGVVYEFSTKDSPVARATLQAILLSGMGRDKYIDRLSRLRNLPHMRDFEVLPQRLDAAAGQRLPGVYFDASFIEFFKDNYSRLLRAIDRDAGMEISVVANGVQRGISREMVDSLRAQVEDRERAVREAKSKASSLERQLEQEQTDHRRSKESASLEFSRIKSVNEALQRAHEEELMKLRKHDEHREQEAQRQIEHAKKAAEMDLERAHRRAEAALADLRATISRLEVDLMKANKSRTQEIQAVRDSLGTQLATQSAATAQAERKCQELQSKLRENESMLLGQEQQSVSVAEQLQKSETRIKQTEAEKKATQAELDDLLMVFGDLEEKVSKYKKRLVSLGEAISDAEDGEEDED